MTATVNNTPTTIAAHCRFFAEYASYMLGCGATCMRIGRNMERMAKTIDATVDMTILPAHILITVTDIHTGESEHRSCGIAHIPVNYEINTRLSKLSWHVAEHKLTLEEAATKFTEIIHKKAMNTWIVMCLVVAANTSLCELFSGDIQAMLIVAFATLVGYSIKNIMLAQHFDHKIMVLTCAFVSAIIGCAGYVFGISETPDIALGTSVLYLIPGIPYINSVSDLLDGHYLCAYSRFAHAMVLTVCVALGLTAGILLMNLNVF